MPIPTVNGMTTRDIEQDKQVALRLHEFARRIEEGVHTKYTFGMDRRRRDTTPIGATWATSEFTGIVDGMLYIEYSEEPGDVGV